MTGLLERLEAYSLPRHVGTNVGRQQAGQLDRPEADQRQRGPLKAFNLNQWFAAGRFAFLV
jgi:hypothetical protein